MHYETTIILLLVIFCISARVVLSQPQTSKDNYTGAWETPASSDQHGRFPKLQFPASIFPILLLTGILL